MDSASLPINHLEMQLINSWEDVKPLVECVVAYKTNSHSIKALYGYCLDDQPIQFGYINDNIVTFRSEEKGYTMIRLLQSGKNPNSCVLSSLALESSTSMRLASIEETDLIKQAVRSDQAAFEYVFNRSGSLAFLEKHIKRVKQINKKRARMIPL